MNKFTDEQKKIITAVLKSQKVNIDIDNPNDLNKSLSDVGIDSLAALGIIVNLEEKFNVHMDDEKIAKVKNISSLLDLLAETINKQN